MQLGNMLDIQKAGLLVIQKNADNTFTLNYKRAKDALTVDQDQMKEIMSGFGWTRYRCDVLKATSHMNSLATKLKKFDPDKKQLNRADVTFEHSYMPDSVKNVWRTRITFNDSGKQFTIVEGLPGLGGKYSILSSMDAFGSSTGFSNMLDALEYVFDHSKKKSILDGYTEEELAEMSKEADA